MKQKLFKFNMDIPDYINGDEIFRNLFEHSTVGMSITSLDDRLHPNAAFCEMLGYSKEELVDKHWDEYTHPDDLAYNHAVIDSILAGGKKSVHWEKRYLHKDGSTIWADIHTFLHRDASGLPLHFITTVNNITKTKIFEDALMESEQRFSTLFLQMNQGVAILDSNGYFLFANPAAEKILGKEKDSLIGTDVRNIFGKTHFDAILSETVKCRSGKQDSFEYEFKLNDGSEKILLGCATPRIKEHNRLETFVLFRDITARKKEEEEIKLQNEQLMESNAEKDKFFAILAHDLRSPLSSFLGLAEVMSEDINNMTMSEIEEISKSLFLSASNLYQLLENLLEWSILRRGNPECHPEPTSLNSLIMRSIEPFLESARRKNIALELDLEQTYSISCDIRMTETVCRNLISNALKYTNSQGSVVIKAIPVNEDEILISITDTGLGMNDDLRTKLFKLNEQVSRKGTEGESSSGLGLLICKELLEQQEGKIWVESVENKGSTFFFTLKLVN